MHPRPHTGESMCFQDLQAKLLPQPAYNVPDTAAPPLGAASDPWLAGLFIESRAPHHNAAPSEPAIIDTPPSGRNGSARVPAAASAAIVAVAIGVLMTGLCTVFRVLRRRHLSRRTAHHLSAAVPQAELRGADAAKSSRRGRWHRWEEPATGDNLQVDSARCLSEDVHSNVRVLSCRRRHACACTELPP